jgi:hypothetical protein
MKCDEARALCTPALDNELSVEQAALFNSHIEQCTSCSSTWENALHIRAGVKDVLKSFPSTADLESRIKLNLDILEREDTRVRRRQWLLAAACILPMLLVAYLTNPELHKVQTVSQSPVSLQTSRELTLEELISKTSHSNESQTFDHGFSSRFVDISQKSEIGFPLVDAKLVSYDLGAVEVFQKGQKRIVRMCFKTDGSDICVDCYEAPSGVIKFGPGIKSGDNQLSVAQVGNVNLVMFSREGVDVVYASELPEDKLMKLVRPNV